MRNKAVFLNSKETKKLSESIEKIFGVRLDKKFAYLKSQDGKIFIVGRKIGDVDLVGLRTNHIGMYMAREENEKLRLSIDATQFLKPKKNVIDISKSEMEAWLKGENIYKKSDLTGVVAVKYEKDFLGCGKIGDNIIHNFVPKERRVYNLH